MRHRSFYVPHPLPVSPPRPRLSPADRSELARRASAARWANVPAKDRAAAASLAAQAMHAKAGHVPPEPVAEVPCPWCGVVMRGAKRKQCGAPECRRLHNAERARRQMHLRRARLLGNEWEAFDPAEVYERDGWVCGICGLPVDPVLTAPDPGSVSLDHVAPVSQRGPHTRENTRCSHLGCNIKRGTRAA